MNRSIRVVWLSLWFGSLSSNYLRIIEGAEFECKLVTSSNHLDPIKELFHDSYFIKFSKLRIFRIFDTIKVVKAVLTTRPDLLIIDLSPRTPILIAQWLLASIYPVLVTIHDPVPHDAQHAINGFPQMIKSLLLSRAQGAITFSDYSSKLLRGTDWNKPVFNLPLLPEIINNDTKFEFERANFAMIGRWSPYKGFDIGLEMWRNFQQFSETKDVLEMWLSGAPILSDLPDRVVVRSTQSFSWDDLMLALPFYRAVLMPYRSATQSGVQVLAWSLGVPCLVSDIEGFVQYQLPSLPGVSVDDSDQWVMKVTDLLKTEYAIDLGRRGRDFLMAEIDPEIIRSRFKEIAALCQ